MPFLPDFTNYSLTPADQVDDSKLSEEFRDVGIMEQKQILQAHDQTITAFTVDQVDEQKEAAKKWWKNSSFWRFFLIVLLLLSLGLYFVFFNEKPNNNQSIKLLAHFEKLERPNAIINENKSSQKPNSYHVEAIFEAIFESKFQFFPVNFLLVGIAAVCLFTTIFVNKILNKVRRKENETVSMNQFAKSCFRYICQNASKLFESEGFLQIEQNLLCGMFESDQLLIDDEYQLWRAALRWADEKCRQKGIECSAENRRSVLGPALFKIRFPNMQKEAFSKSVVPSGVLTMEEVIGVYQFNALPNLRGVGGIYPLKFPTQQRISDWNKGTLSMEIEKLSEFAQETVGSSRYSQSVQIMGHPWKILAEIKTKNGSTEKCLGFYLWCNASKNDDNWGCKCSATYRIVSEKTKTENSIGKLNDRVFNNKLNNWGLPNFITFAELMDPNKGLYNKTEDKVTLAIDVFAEEPKTDKIISDPNKSNGTIKMEIDKLSEFAREIFGSERRSETVRIKGLPWKISTQIAKLNGGTEKCLGFFLRCDASKDKNWSCKCSATLRIVSQKDGTTDLKYEFSENTFDNESISWGFSDFISFAELMNPIKGLYNEKKDTVKLAIDFAVNDAKTHN